MTRRRARVLLLAVWGGWRIAAQLRAERLVWPTPMDDRFEGILR